MKAQLHWFWAYDIKHRARRYRERFLTWIAWHLPRELVMWCFVRVASHATMGEYGGDCPDKVSIMDALERWRD
jgi:hypothetical protein